MSEPKYFIYAFRDPRDMQIRYIGMSSRGMARPKAHFFPSKLAKERTHKRNWIVQLQEQGLMPEVVILEIFDSYEPLPGAERKYIAEYKALGHSLTNLTDGGEGVPGRKLSESARKKLSDANKGRIFSPETRARISAAAKAQFADPEKRARCLEAQRLARTPEVYQKMSEGQKRRFSNPEAGRKTALAGGGRPFVCVQTGEIFVSLAEAARKLKVQHSNIWKVLKGRLNHTGGYGFKYVDPPVDPNNDSTNP